MHHSQHKLTHFSSSKVNPAHRWTHTSAYYVVVSQVSPPSHARIRSILSEHGYPFNPHRFQVSSEPRETSCQA
jgi:hypothetical protein